MKYIQKVVAWLNARKAKKERIANERIVRASEERVQLREFKGDIYIAIDGIPVFAVSSTSKMAVPALEEARQTFRTYITKK